MANDPSKLTVEEALSLIDIHMEGRKKRTHTFEGYTFGLMGCDMDLSTIKKELMESDDIQLSGPNMASMNHGLAYFRKGRGYLFVRTDAKKILEIFKKRKISQK